MEFIHTYRPLKWSLPSVTFTLKQPEASAELIVSFVGYNTTAQVLSIAKLQESVTVTLYYDVMALGRMEGYRIIKRLFR